MLFLDVITILATGLMVGNELAVSLFVNPVMWRLDTQAQATALGMFARLLGKWMPYWYAACLLLFALEGYAHRHDHSLVLFSSAALLWIAIILGTVMVLVPINNRIASMDPIASPFGWQRAHRRWDRLHRVRILLLMVAMVLVVMGIITSR